MVDDLTPSCLECAPEGFNIDALRAEEAEADAELEAEIQLCKGVMKDIDDEMKDMEIE